ncbi:hypothetical protein [Streptomyces sp. NPDC047972]|uniref:hypothetical protein n=1 Tax=Streptomyces sp. NPDC047972 TaxID=3365493 RepID=UPI0037245386
MRVVFGVGRFDEGDIADLGYRSLARVDLVHDVLGMSGTSLRAEGVLANALPNILRNTRYVPVWKYLRDTGRIQADGTFDVGGLDDRIGLAAGRRIEDLQPNPYYTKRFNNLTPSPRTPAELDGLGLVELVNFTPLLDTSSLDVEQLRTLLVQRMSQCGPGTSHLTTFHKCVCLYDLLRYGPGRRET